jgi:hypothetical protein
MSDPKLSTQINKIGFYAVALIIVFGVLSLFFPLSAPEATQEGAIYWLMNSMSAYVVGWIVQIVGMLLCAVIFACVTWPVFAAAPIRAVVLWVLTCLSVMAFLIPKFIALWSVPLMAKALAAGTAESVAAEAFLTVLAPGIAFGFVASLDYLGFGLYATIGILLFRPLWKISAKTKVAAIALLIFGVSFFLILLATFIGLLGQADVAGYLDAIFGILLIAFIPLMLHFRSHYAAPLAKSASE